MKAILPYILIVFLIFSCKKEPEEIQLSGRLYDSNAGQYVGGATVSVQATGVVDGVFNAGFTTIATGQTDVNGNFEFLVAESAYDALRFTFIKNGYFVTQVEKSAAYITPESPYYEVFTINSKSYIKVRIRNINPYDEQDMINFYFNYPPEGCQQCCNSQPVTMSGMDIDTTINCVSFGNYTLKVNYSYTRNNSIYYFLDSMLTIPFDTTYFNIDF